MLDIPGFIYALAALFSWGLGDFLIQKTTRKVGSWQAMFYIGITATVILAPFVYFNLSQLDFKNLILLSTLSIVVVFATLFDFEALKRGKLSVVDPITGLELPITVGLTIILLQEGITIQQLACILLVFVGLMLIVTKHKHHLFFHRRVFEKGVIFAGLAAVGMALMNFLVGLSSQQISPLTTIWFTHTTVAVIAFLYIVSTGQFKDMVSNFKKHRTNIIGQSFFDNVAWVSFAQATTLIPIAIATSISESYIVLAVLLGLFVNREKLRSHQIFGVLFATAGVIILSYLSS